MYFVMIFHSGKDSPHFLPCFLINIFANFKRRELTTKLNYRTSLFLFLRNYQTSIASRASRTNLKHNDLQLFKNILEKKEQKEETFCI